VATWQFDFHLVPRMAVGRQFGGVPLTLSRSDYDDGNWWAAHDAGFSFVSDPEGFLRRLADAD
jgi:hypothetical protein